MAGPSPRSVRIAGWMPRASSRSSLSATASLEASSSTSGSASLAAHARLEQAQVEREADELLLGAVVEVALEPAARGVGGLDDAHARDAQLLHARAQVGLQALVVECERGRRGGRLHELGAGLQRRVVDDRRDAPAVALDRRPRAPGAAVGQHDGPARPRRRTPRGRAASRRSTACGRRGSRPASRVPGRRPRGGRSASTRTAAASPGRASRGPRRARIAAGTASSEHDQPGEEVERQRGRRSRPRRCR